MKRTGFLAVLMLGMSASFMQAQEAMDVSQILLKGISDRSPLGRHQRKDFSPGVKLFNKDARCSLDDLKLFFDLQRPPILAKFPDDNVVYKDKEVNLHTRDLSLVVKDFEKILVDEITAQMRLFESANDPVVKNRELCIEAAEFSIPNAFSIGFGFLVFDPHLFFQVLRHEKSNEWSLRAILAHELAHQLQIWHLDPTLFRQKNGRSFVRDKELQADCVAAGILARQSKELPKGRSDDPLLLSLSNAFISLGDFEVHHEEGHHGTAYERSLMVRLGIEKAKELASQQPLTSGRLLNACRSFIDEMNIKFGDEIWPFGSSL